MSGNSCRFCVKNYQFLQSAMRCWCFFNVVIALVKTENISIIYLGRMRKIPFDFVSFEYLTINCIARIHVENH